MATKKQAPTTGETEDTGTPNDRLKKNLARFDASWEYARGAHHQRWEDAWKLYNNKRVHYNYKGTSNTFVPMTFGAIETMVAALGNGRPSFDYEPEYPTQNDETEVLNTLVDNFWDRDQWDVKVVEIIRQMLMLGTAPAYLYWDVDHPRMVHFPIRDAIIDPSLVSPEQLLNGCGYAGRRYLTSVEELKEFEIVDADPKSKTYGEMKPRFQNLDQVHGEATGSAGGAVMDKQLKDMFMGSTLTKPEGKQVEIIEIWDEDRVVSIANRSVVIEDIINPTKQVQIDRNDPNPKGLIPFVFFRDYTDVSSFYGKGEIDPIKQHQEMLNDLTNQNVDAITLQLSPQVELDPSQASWINKIDNTPGRVYPFKPGTISWRQVPVIPANAFNERTNIKQEIREATAIDQISKGVSDTNSQNTTATAVRAQLNQAGQRIDIKALMLEKDGFYQLGVVLFKLIQIYVDKPALVKVATATGTDLKVFNPDEFLGNYRPRVQLDITAKQTKADEQQKAIQAYQMLIQDPTNNLQAAKKILYPRMLDLDQKEIEEIITPNGQEPGGAAQGMSVEAGAIGPDGQPQPQQPGAPGQAQAQGQPQPAADPSDHPIVKLLETLQIKFEKLPEDVQMQLIEQIFGITPQSPSPGQQLINLKQQAQDHTTTTADNATKIQVVQHLMQSQQAAQQQPQGGQING